MSVYSLDKIEAAEADADKLWVVTEHDRSVTTVLLPREY